MKIRFYLKKGDLNKAGEQPIRADINIRGVRLQRLIGYTISAAKWDGSAEEVKKGCKNEQGKDYRIINSRITDIESHFTAFDLTLDDKPTPQQLAKEFEKAINKNAARIAAITNKESEQVVEEKVAEAEVKEKKPKVKPAVAYLDEFIREERINKSWSYDTCRMMNSFKNHVEKFSKTAGLDYFDTAGIDKFINYLRSKADLQEASVVKQYKNLGWFLRWAIRKKYTQVRDIETYDASFKVVKKPVIFLTQEELETLYKFEIPANGTEVDVIDKNGNKDTIRVKEAEGLSRARDLFCFCAFTGLRYSDVVEVRRTDIQKGILTITTQKTHDRLPIVLHKNALAILNKYKKMEFQGNRALPYMTNQQMNRDLKDLCQICQFNTPIPMTFYRNGARVDMVLPKWTQIGTHTGRKTFICFALSNGIAPDVVMKFTGHSDYKSMKPYIDITEDAKKKAIKVMEKAFNKKTK